MDYHKTLEACRKPTPKPLRKRRSRRVKWFEEGYPLNMSAENWSIRFSDSIDIECPDSFASIRPSDQIVDEDVDSIFKVLDTDIVTFVKEELKRYKREVTEGHHGWFETEMLDEELLFDGGWSESREALQRIAQHFLRKRNHGRLAGTLQHKMAQHRHKLNLKRRLFERNAEEGYPPCLNQISTELYITDKGKAVIYKHEFRQIETASMEQTSPGQTIKCEDMFKPFPGRDQPNRTVMTCGISGSGKSVSTDMFILTWVNNTANQDIEFIFLFTFRELNLLKNKRYSLKRLLKDFFRETAEIYRYEYLQILFIFDGLDECQIPLDFSNNEIVTSVMEPTSIDVLLTSLIRGNLLPSARIWVTSRHAAATLIPRKYFDLVTEVRGFTDPQKEEFFQKRFGQEIMAPQAISHVKTLQTLNTMCYIPLFCEVIAIVLEDILTPRGSQELPKTVTVFYIHFLLVQSKLIHLKYHREDDIHSMWSKTTRQMILSLGKLAFVQLRKGNLIFHEEDLRQCHIDIQAASVYSGMLTQICVSKSIHKAFCFIHLSIQEFLAALYVYVKFSKSGVNLLSGTQTTSRWSAIRRQKPAAKDLYQRAVDMALECPHGHLDLFLRFLLGLSLKTNQTLLQGLLEPMENSSVTIQETIQYIKEKIKQSPSIEKSINLFHCLNEINDYSLVDESRQFLSSESLPVDQLSPAQGKALIFVLLSSVNNLDVFDLKKYSASEEGLLMLLPVVTASSTALLNGCKLTGRGCEALASVLSSPSCNVRELDLSNNSLEDAGVKLLFAGLENKTRRLKTLRLNGCKLTEGGCEALASVLSSPSCNLRELDLSNNDLEDSGVKLLSAGLGSANCKLKTLRLSGCLVTEEGCAALASALKSNPFHLRELDLSYNHPGEKGVGLLSAGLDDPQFALETLRVDHGGEKRLRYGQRKWPAGKLNHDPSGGATDSSDWTELEPVVDTVDEVQTYSLQSDAGRFQCSKSDLRWVCKEEVSFNYQFCSWEEHMERLSLMDYMPAGPLMNITVTSGKLEEAHLPHWICVDDSSKMSDMFAVLHLDTCGDIVEQVSEVTSSHIKLLQPVFSPRGAVLLKKLGINLKVSYDVFIYKTVKADLTLHVYLVPPDPVLQKAVEEEEKSEQSKKIRKPMPDKSFQMESDYYLSTHPGTSEICPEKRRLTSERRNPHFFEVFVRNAQSNFCLKLECEQKKNKGRHLVWSCTIRTDDYQNKSTDHETASGQHFVDRHRIALINRVTDTGAILDELMQSEFISRETYNKLGAVKTTEDQMRDILKIVIAAGNETKDAFCDILKKMKHLRPLISELEKLG